ncbi:MAG: 3-deoxy-manno-octulosonate cytidylyltransferase [Endozoicomonas sp. (ex Botrylloides leachii)]|nr:3-deoxy-manno-octulosonate cytidylyltransferase [Endozoicomonas sp. (ex Botrylloides leachii)]
MREKQPFIVVIPARFGSSRLLGKPLVDIGGKPMIQHVYERALQSRAQRVIIATDDSRIKAAAEAFQAEVCMTSTAHPTGTDRLQEVALLYGLNENDIIVNVQGDEPLIPPKNINQVADAMTISKNVGAATLCEKIKTYKEMFDPNVVKLTVNSQGIALYFSRAPIPWDRNTFADGANTALPEKLSCCKRHIGIYAYRVGLLNRFVAWGMCPIEEIESLEQLRLLWHGQKIQVVDALETPPGGVDTKQDLENIRRFFANS